MPGLRPDWDYTNVPAGVRQVHQGYFGTVTWEEMHQADPYPEDHVEVAELLADLPANEREETLMALHPEFDVELLDHLLHVKLVSRYLKRFHR